MINLQDTINFDPITDDSAISQFEKAAADIAELFVGLLDEIAAKEHVSKPEKGLENKASMSTPFMNLT